VTDTSRLEHAYERFITTIQQKARLSWEDAERAADTTLATLAERLSAGQARDIAEQLPAPLRQSLVGADVADPFHADEFLRRIAEREGVDPGTAERHARAVFIALGRTVKADELADMAAELPKDFQPLLALANSEAEGLYPKDFLPVEEFVTRVADRSGQVPETARQATEAVLETLGERIAGGEVEDLAGQLPAELRPALERGNARSGGKAERLSLDEFLSRVAEREGVSPQQAREHARAVFITLGEAISEKELADLVAELPTEYAALFERP
jgi:uncharacterized protein (DUF2267 family)